MDVLAVLIMRGGFRGWGRKFGGKWGFVVWLRGVGSLGEGYFAVGVFGYVRVVARSRDLILMGVLLIRLACCGCL